MNLKNTKIWTPKVPQVLGRDFILDVPRCNVWMDPGMGKTSLGLAAVDILKICGSSFLPALVIAPKRVACDVWTEDALKFTSFHGLKVTSICGASTDKMTPSTRVGRLAPGADIYTINYENLPWLVSHFGKNWPFKMVFADESTKLKSFRLSHGSKRAAALAKVAKLTGRWVNLTGTPAPNGLIDLWGQMWFVDFGQRLGRTFSAFKGRWFDTWEFEVRPREYAAAQIQEAISDVTISLRARDFFDELDEPIPMPIYVDLPDKARSTYNDMEIDLFAELGDVDVEAFTAATKSNKCSQIASGAVYTDDKANWTVVHDAKIDALRALIDEMDGEPLLVVYRYKHDLARILKAFPKIARLYQNKDDENDWNARKIPLMLGHPASMGHGLNFQDGGCTVCHFSQTWDLEHRLQVMERIGPMRQLQSGHPRPVRVFEIIARDTVDEVMYARVAGKMSVQDALRRLRKKRDNELLIGAAVNDALGIFSG